MSLDARIGRGGLDRTLCAVVDLSVSGARLQTYSELWPGVTIWLALSKIGRCAARVIWVHHFERGWSSSGRSHPRSLKHLRLSEGWTSPNEPEPGCGSRQTTSCFGNFTALGKR
ncbi:hypothetical protein [Sphingomonas sp. Root241]|uniref:hypothetical protein n=1 Tax=Sphingomonas sp. Root241 TaxID=1736501 RepID=UPI001F268EC0|nr:hypothetical protein [Sphingomonas sp. Root241]